MPDEPQLILKRALGPDRMVDDYDVLCEGEVVGHIFKSGPLTKPWFWGFAYGHYDRSPTHGYEGTREGCPESYPASPRIGADFGSKIKRLRVAASIP
jgi:hypothetical protein